MNSKHLHHTYILLALQDICLFPYTLITYELRAEPRGYYPGLNERVPGTSECGGAGHPFRLFRRGYFTALTKTLD